MGPQGPAGPAGPAGPGFPDGSVLMLVHGSAAPEGFTLVGTGLQVLRTPAGEVVSLRLDVYRKN